MGIFRIATYNVNSVRSRLHIVIPWLRKHQPDVLCLQETKVADGEFEIDVHDPKRLLGHVCFTPEVWEAFASVRSWGVDDMFRWKHPGSLSGRFP